MEFLNLTKGTISPDSKVRILDEDRLCFLVESKNKGAEGVRTISKYLLKEIIDYLKSDEYKDAEDKSNSAIRATLKERTKVDKYEYGYIATLVTLAKMSLGEIIDSEECDITPSHKNFSPIQTIYFGSPGTGKSYGIKNELLEKGIDEEKKINTDRLFRTTFHPDTDYSAFVGCYKPICNQVKLNIKDITQLKAEAQALMNEITQKPGAKVEMLSTFMADNAEPLLKAEAEGNSWKSILDQVFSKGYINNDSYLHSLCKIVAGINDKQTTSISYKFTPQVFTLAYEKAWNLLNCPDKSADEKQVYLVIEEINRGNCAQIFGDLFQLLDRKNDGYSEYPVKADTDLYNYLISLEGWGKNHPGILNGNLCLPPNLNIIATMNTSDQSLFPMDSAFKRRWEWKYIPTTAPVGEEFDITIDAGDKEYSWKLFLEKINEMILRATNSEDKQLGFWFVKADKSTKQIPTSTFVSKVVFYLWNDVFKDMGAKGTNPFTILYEGKNELMSFNSFFEIKPDGKIVENLGVLHSFLKNVGLEPK